MTYAELAARCRIIHTRITMLASLDKGEELIAAKLKAEIAEDWRELVVAYDLARAEPEEGKAHE